MGSRSIRIALAQMEVVAGKPQRNLDVAVSLVEQASKAGAQLVVLPGFCLSGYPLPQDGCNTGFLAELRRCEDELIRASRTTAIAFGSYDPALPHWKGDLDALDWQSATRIAAHGKLLEPAENGDVRLALGQCECILVTRSLSADRPGARGAIEAESEDKLVRIQVRSSYLPWCIDAAAKADEIAPSVDLGLSCNPVGIADMGSGVLTLAGDSRACMRTASGFKQISCNSSFEQELTILDADFASGHLELREASGVNRGVDSDERLLDALVSTIRRFDEQVFAASTAWVIGLSGGLDSSMTAALLALALEDRSRIHAYSLSSRYNSDTTKSNARTLAEALGISLASGSIEDLVAATKGTALSYGYKDCQMTGLVEENIQARLRGHMLSTFAALEGGVVVNNGNKIECALGYATLYGDAIGALAPLADLTKVRMFGLAHAINSRLGRAAIPQNLLPMETATGYDWEMMPSAELKDAQKDPMKWFYHDWLIERILENQGDPLPLMQAYQADAFESLGIQKWVRFYGLDDPRFFIEDLEWVLRQMRGSTFKRFQSPPGLVFTHSSFACGYFETQMKHDLGQEYEELRASILANDSAH